MVFWVLTPSSLVPNASIFRVELCKMRNQLGYTGMLLIQIHVICYMFFRNVGIHIEDSMMTTTEHNDRLEELRERSMSQTDPSTRELHFDTASPAQNCSGLSLCSLTNGVHKAVHECLGILASSSNCIT